MEIIKRKDAKAAGLTRYFTGKPCPRGHVCERLVSGFGCVECAKISCANYYRSHRGDVKARMQERYAERRDEFREKAKIYRGENRDRRIEYMKQYHALRKEENRVRRHEYYSAHKKQEEVNRKNYRKANPERVKAYVVNRRARLIEIDGELSPEQITAIIREGKVCHICGKKFSKRDRPHLDHVIPITHSLGTNDMSNIAPTHKTCNSRKKDSLFNPITKQGYLL